MVVRCRPCALAVASTTCFCHSAYGAVGVSKPASPAYFRERPGKGTGLAGALCCAAGQIVKQSCQQGKEFTCRQRGCSVVADWLPEGSKEGRYQRDIGDYNCTVIDCKGNLARTARIFFVATIQDCIDRNAEKFRNICEVVANDVGKGVEISVNPLAGCLQFLIRSLDGPRNVRLLHAFLFRCGLQVRSYMLTCFFFRDHAGHSLLITVPLRMSRRCRPTVDQLSRRYRPVSRQRISECQFRLGPGVLMDHLRREIVSDFSLTSPTTRTKRKTTAAE